MKPFPFVFGKRDRTRVFEKPPDREVSEDQDEICLQIEGIRAEDIINHRKRLGLTQIQYAQRLGVSLRSLQNWEQQVKKPNPSTAQEIMKMMAEEIA